MSYGLEIRNASGVVTFSTERWCLLLADVVFVTIYASAAFTRDYPEYAGCMLELHVEPYYQTCFGLTYIGNVPRLSYTPPTWAEIYDLEVLMMTMRAELYIFALPPG